MQSHSVRPEVLRLRPYVPGKSAAEVSRELGLSSIVKLASNENPLGPSPRALEALARISPQVCLYPEPTAPVLREALAAHLALPADWIMVGNGSDELLRLLAATYIRPGDAVILPECSFPNYRAVSELFGAQVTEVPLRAETMDLAEMARQAEQGARFCFLCRPNNPTGAVFGEAALRRFLTTVPPSTFVLLDQAYHEFDGSPFDSMALLKGHPNLILTRTFSKAYGLAGLRVGYGMARPEIWEPLYTVREPFSVNLPAQAAAVAALGDTEHLEQTRLTAAEGRARLIALCAQLGLYAPRSEANFVLIDLARPAGPVFEHLLRAGVIVRPCDGFRRPTCIRVTVGLPHALDRFEAALRSALCG